LGARGVRYLASILPRLPSRRANKEEIEKEKRRSNKKTKKKKKTEQTNKNKSPSKWPTGGPAATTSIENREARHAATHLIYFAS